MPRAANKTNITQEVVRSCFVYNAETGIFTWKIKRSKGKISVGDVAGHVCKKKGYVHIRLDGFLYLAHRLAWLYVFGVWPAGEVDHINSIRSDNRIKNLRDVSHSINQQNVKFPQKNNTSGFLGVTRKRKKWSASIQHGDKHISLGVFDKPEDAHAAYLLAKSNIHAGFSTEGMAT